MSNKISQLANSVSELIRKIESLTNAIYKLSDSNVNVVEVGLPEVEADFNKMNLQTEKRKSRISKGKLDDWKCKGQVIRMHLTGRYSFQQLAEYASRAEGKPISYGSIYRYFNNRFKIAKLNKDGSLEVIEKSGKITRYTSDGKVEVEIEKE